MKHHLAQRVRATGALFGVYAVVILVAVVVDLTHLSPVWVNLITYLVLGAGVLVIRRTRWFTSRWDDANPPRDPEDDLSPIGSYGFVVCVLVALVAALATTLYTSGQTRGSAITHMSSGDKLAVALLAPLIGPIAEELVMRGLIYPVARRGWGIVVSILVSATSFAILHADTVAFVYTFVLGAILAFVYETSRRLKDVVTIHVAFNVAAIFTSSLDTSRWLGAGLSHVLAVVVWIMLFIGLYEHVTMVNDTRAGRRMSRRGTPASTREGHEEEQQSA